MTTDFKRLTQIIAIAVSFAALQSCAALAERTITMKPGTKNVRTVQLPVEDPFDPYKSVVKMNDARIVRVAKDEDKENLKIRMFSSKLDTLWSKYYKCDEDESMPTVWCSGNDINILTTLVLDDSLKVIARKIDSKDGKLIQKINLFKDDLDRLNGIEYAQFTISSDSSKVLVTVAPEVKEKDDKSYSTARIVLFGNDFSQIYTKQFSMEIPENNGNEVGLSFGWGGLGLKSTTHTVSSPLLVNGRGDIYYSSYDLEKDAVWETMYRLAAGENVAKKIKATSASVKNAEENGWPVQPQVVITSDDNISTAWLYANGELTQGFSTAKYDFTQNVPLFNTLNKFTTGDAKKLIDEDEFENYRLVRTFNLPNGETFNLLESYRVSTSYSSGMPIAGMGGMRSAPSTTYTYITGPYVAIKTGARGEKIWINSFIKDESSLDNYAGESSSSIQLTDSSVICAYRSRAKEGVSICEFMLADGAVRTATLPFEYTHHAIFYPEMTVWNNDKTATFFGQEGSDGIKVVNLSLPEMKPYVKPLNED
ncbi:MAG: hypothetical protein V4642_15930 [Bacteroidota bacterium]